MKVRGSFLSVLAMLAIFSGSAAMAKKTEIQVWDWYKDRMDLIKPMAIEYQKANPNVVIKLSMVDWDSYPSKVLASVIGGNPPDVIQFHNSWTGYLLKVLAPFPPELFPSSRMSDEFYQFNTAFRMKDGKFYFYPDGLMGGLMFYNKKLYNQAGLSSTPKTWDEFRMVAKKLTQKGGDGKMSVGGFAFSPALLFDDINYQMGGGIYNDTHTGLAWNEPEAAKAMNLVGSMALSDGIRPTFTGFETNKIGMQYNWTWFKSSLLKIQSSKLQWGTFPIPTPNGGDTDIRGRNNYECGYAVPANLKGNKKSEAFKFLKWLYANDAYYLKLNDVMGRLPGKKEMWTKSEIANDAVQGSLAKQIPYTIFPGERPNWIDTIQAKMEADILAGKVSPIDGLKRAQAEGEKQWKIAPPKWIVEKRLGKVK